MLYTCNINAICAALHLCCAVSVLHMSCIASVCHFVVLQKRAAKSFGVILFWSVFKQLLFTLHQQHHQQRQQQHNSSCLQ